MSTEKNPEVVGCDASIMKNVWEIREREYGQKMQLEQERLEKSALPSINKDWAGRLAARQGGYRREERKPRRVEPPQTDNNVWKSKQSQVPSASPRGVGSGPTLPRGVGSGPLGRPGVHSTGFSSTASSSKDKKVQDKAFNRLQLLTFINQTQPSPMVWGKAWKYSKCLPPPVEGTTPNPLWGQCWMFSTHQPFSEAGQPWPNGPNKIDPHMLHLWGKPEYKEMESQELGLSLPTEEWQMSWKKPVKNNKDDASANGEKSEFFTLMVETQHRNEALCSSEWNESWRSTKPADEQHEFTDLMIESKSNKQNNDREMSSDWENCWRLANHHGCNNVKLPQPKKCHSPEWVNSWRAAMVVTNNHKNSDPSLRQDHSNAHQKESYFHNNMPVSPEHKYRDLYMQLCSEFKALSEWSKSWEVTKNNSKPCEEIEKVLKASPPRMEAGVASQRVEEKAKVHSTSEKVDPYYEQLKHDIIYRPKREFTQSKLLLLKHLVKFLPSSEWRDCWKIINHRMRMERRRMRPDPLRPFRQPEQGGDMKPTASEWKDSWKFTSQPLRQEPDQWQQGWTTTTPVRAYTERHLNHFAPVELPKNGPNTERSWDDSWRFSRRQHSSQPGQGRQQINQGRPSLASHHHENSHARGRHVRPTSDWQAAWMVSDAQFHHDTPSLTQWRAAWQWSIYHTQHWTEQVSTENWVDELMEIQPLREKVSLQRAKAKMSRSFDDKMFRERYPEKEWNPSWSAGSLLKHQQNHHGSSGVTEKSMSNTTQLQHASAGEYGSKWGRSFRLANPMPHMDQPWVESYPNPCYYSVMWSRGKKRQNHTIINFINNPATFKLWQYSNRFLQSASAQVKDKSKSWVPTDPRVIVTRKTNTRRHLYSKIEQVKQADRAWAGCHLLGKTQPRPKKGPGSVKKIMLEDQSENKFFEEWAESWRLLVRPASLKKQMSFKSLSGWNESWKFLFPLYQPLNGPKAK